jgi:hypothetical protein
VPADALITVAEESAFRCTGRTEEVTRLCAAFAAAWPHAVRNLDFGRSAQGRPMRALLACRADPRTVPVLMLQGGIHPGESDGKDAGFIALRELLRGTAAPGVLERLAILFVPAFNVDGHERFGRWNRPNQNGPEETGWRTTAQNLNLNRDYTKADTPEMRALLALIREWDPLVCADLHVTDGADFQPDVSLQAEPINQGDAELYPAARLLRDALIERLAAQGSLPLPFYPDLAVQDDPASGFLLTVYSPRFSTGYFPQRNRFTVLVETHSWKDYATRVRVTRNTIVALAELLAAHGPAWQGAAVRADAAAARLGGTEVVLDYSSGWREGASGHRTDAGGAQGEATIEFPGYAYTRELSPISGEPVTVYDPQTPQVWRVPFRDRVLPSLSVRAPLGGYLVPRAWAAAVGGRLAAHGIVALPLRRVPRSPSRHSVPRRHSLRPTPSRGACALGSAVAGRTRARTSQQATSSSRSRSRWRGSSCTCSSLRRPIRWPAGASSTPASSRRSTWSPTSPSRSRRVCSPATRTWKPSSDSGCSRMPPLPPILRRAASSSCAGMPPGMPS